MAGMPADDAMRLIGEELRPRRRPAAQPGHVRDDLDGAGGAADHRREPAPQLHRPRRVPASRPRSSSAASGCSPTSSTRPARPPAPHPGLLRGDHARRAVAEVEVEGAPRGRRQADRPAQPGLRRRRARRLGEVLPLLRRRAADRPARARASTRSAPTTSSRTSTRTRSASRPSSARRSPGTWTTSSGSTGCCST